MKIIRWASIIMFIMTIMILSCKSSSENKYKAEEYTVKIVQNPNVYGLDIKKMINQSFSQIEKETGAKIQIDEEVSSIFIDKEKDFISKSFGTTVKDYIDFLYVPINDDLLYKISGSLKPKTIVFYGHLKLNENMDTKKTIIKELGTVLPKNSTTNSILNSIEHKYFTGSYNDQNTIQINFETPDFEVAYFFITFMAGEIHYRYVFSKTKDIDSYL